MSMCKQLIKAVECDEELASGMIAHYLRAHGFTPEFSGKYHLDGGYQLVGSFRKDGAYYCYEPKFHMRVNDALELRPEGTRLDITVLDASSIARVLAPPYVYVGESVISPARAVLSALTQLAYATTDMKKKEEATDAGRYQYIRD